MVLVAVRALRLVARDAVTDVDAGEQPERDQLVDDAVDRGAADAAAVAGAQLVLDVERGQRAGLLVQQLDDGLAGAAAPVAGAGEPLQRVLGPRLLGVAIASMIGRSGGPQAARRDVAQVGLDPLAVSQQRRKQDAARDRVAWRRGWRARRR